MAGPKGYNSYRGKSARGKILLAVLLVLVILGAVAVIRVQKYMVYDDSGRPRLELPWRADASGGAAGSGASGSALSEAPEVSLTIEEPTRVDTRAVSLPAEALTDWRAAWDTAAETAENANAAVYTVKTPGGMVYLDNQAVPVSALRTVEGTGAAVGDMLKDGSVYAIARLACFRDPIASSGALEEMGLKNTGGFIFYDGNSERWLDPAKPAARQYLIDLAVGCASVGFDELLLTDVSYPTEGKLDKIDYGEAAALPGGRVSVVTGFVRELKEALAAYDVKLSLLLPAELLISSADGSDVSGQSPKELLPLADRVYVRTGADKNLTARLEKAVDAFGGDAEFVPILESGADGAEDASWLVEKR